MFFSTCQVFHSKLIFPDLRYFGSVLVQSVFQSRQGVICLVQGAGCGRGPDTQTFPPGNVRNLRSDVLMWGYPLSPDNRQLLQNPVKGAFLLNIKCLKYTS